MLRRAIEELSSILLNSWSYRSSSKWTPGNPAKGQCGVTALVINEILGGEILKTMTLEGWHYYNHINGERIDLTKSQFTEPMSYQDITSNWKEAFSDTNHEQYNYLKQSILLKFPKGESLFHK